MNDPNVLFVCAMGLGVVFCGLIFLILVSVIASKIINLAQSRKKPENKPDTSKDISQSEPIANRKEFVAAVSAVIAEQLGTDINAIRIKSIKKV